MGVFGINAFTIQHIRQLEVITKFRSAGHLGLGVDAMKRTADRRADGIQIQSKNLPLKKHVEWENRKCTDHDMPKIIVTNFILCVHRQSC